MQADTGAKLVAGPFSYTIRRAMIRTSGKLDSRGFWRLDSKQYVDEEKILKKIAARKAKPKKKSDDAFKYEKI